MLPVISLPAPSGWCSVQPNLGIRTEAQKGHLSVQSLQLVSGRLGFAPRTV